MTTSGARGYNVETKLMMDLLAGGASKLGLTLTPAELDTFDTFYRELVDWNKRVNLTAIAGYEDVQTKHFLDSLTIVLALDSADALNRPGASLIDIGTGAGMPGLPLKIVFPRLRLTLVESVMKKVRFLEFMVVKLGLTGVEVLNERAEDLAHRPEYREKFDLATARGVGPLATAAELCVPFCKIGGLFVAQKKGDIGDEIGQARFAVAALGAEIRETRKVQLGELPDNRTLVLVEKKTPTPANYPRRAGMPAKRPLAAHV